jgi:mRNA-degrading endonuclease HigB of HigAB toxin-antitoxin module
MKIVGRKMLADADVSPLGKKRLTLWIKRVAEARWLSISHIKEEHPDIQEIGKNRLLLPFRSSNIEVEVIVCLSLGIIYVDRISELEGKQQ